MVGRSGGEEFCFSSKCWFLKRSVLSLSLASLLFAPQISGEWTNNRAPRSLWHLSWSIHLVSFSLFAPPTAGPKSLIADTERIEVSWCTKAGYGTRLIPEGTITSAQFLSTDTFVQIIGKGDMTKVNVFPKDEGGELDPHGADGLGNPIGEWFSLKSKMSEKRESKKARRPRLFSWFFQEDSSSRMVSKAENTLNHTSGWNSLHSIPSASELVKELIKILNRCVNTSTMCEFSADSERKRT